MLTRACIKNLVNLFAFQAIQKPYAHFTKLCIAVFCKFWGDVWEEIVFLKGLVKFREIRNIKDLQLKIGRWPAQESPDKRPLGALAWGSTIWWCFKNNFLSSIPSLNLLTFHSNPCLPPPKNLFLLRFFSEIMILELKCSIREDQVSKKLFKDKPLKCYRG